jgi:hypothetical protein
MSENEEIYKVTMDTYSKMVSDVIQKILSVTPTHQQEKITPYVIFSQVSSVIELYIEEKNDKCS